MLSLLRRSSKARALSSPIHLLSNTASLRTRKNMASYKKVPVSTEFQFPLDQPVVYLDSETAFAGLSEREKLYAHCIAQASWGGGLIVPFQTSRESPIILLFLLKFFGGGGRNIESVKAVARDLGLSDEDIQGILVYTAGFLENLGNYKGHGDTKFVPALPREKLEILVNGLNDEKLLGLWKEIAEDVYELNERTIHLGLGPNGVTTYFSANCTKEDGDLVTRFLDNQQISAYNTRVLKLSNSKYEVRLAAALKSDALQTIEFENCSFVVVAGDYDLFMERVVGHLEEAIKHAANDTQAKMLENYVLSFRTGSLDAHKDGSRYWIKDKGPVVESYIGFIETYRDPAGTRGEWEGFVAVVNKELSKKFQALVKNAEKFLPLLPWGSAFEKDEFLKPDFTSLDVMAFASSGVPAGINIPNYDEIRQIEGFKNVSLGNVIQGQLKPTVIPFLSKEDAELLKVKAPAAFELQVGLHELLGHGCGKMLTENKDGVFNFPKDSLVNPLTGKLVEHWYRDGETFDSKFGALGSSYEECRAEACALHLNLFREVLETFGLTDPAVADDLQYLCWLQLLWGGLKSLEMYQPGDGSWLQAHARARFVILQVMLEAGLVTIVEKVSVDDGKPDLLVTVPRDQVRDVGGPALAQFLKKIQIYKATGDVEAARVLYDYYSQVDEKFTKWRDIVIARKQPRKFIVQANTSRKDESVELKGYPATVEGMILSFLDRYGAIFQDEGFYQKYLALWKRDEEHFRLY